MIEIPAVKSEDGEEINLADILIMTFDVDNIPMEQIVAGEVTLLTEDDLYVAADLASTPYVAPAKWIPTAEVEDPNSTDGTSEEPAADEETAEVIPEEEVVPKYAIAKEDITDEHRLIALSMLSYMNMIKRKVEMEAVQMDL
jgi:hypothetical protein